MITQDKMEAAMEFLADTDIKFAEAKTQLLQSEILCKRVRSRIFLVSEGSIEARKASAETNQEVCIADDELCEAMKEFEALKARRSRAEIVIDVWRSINASMRKS